MIQLRLIRIGQCQLLIGLDRHKFFLGLEQIGREFRDPVAKPGRPLPPWIIGHGLRSGGLQPATTGHETDFDAALHRSGDAIEHGEGMAFVVGVLQP